MDSVEFPVSGHTVMHMTLAETLCAGFKGLDLLQVSYYHLLHGWAYGIAFSNEPLGG